ncbi:hypothetical protein LTS17_001873 [Exophiala oligosperma]
MTTPPPRLCAIVQECPSLKQAGLFAPKDYKHGDLLFSETAVVVGTVADLGDRPVPKYHDVPQEEWKNWLGAWLEATRTSIPTLRWFVETGTLEGMNYPKGFNNFLDREAYSTFITESQYLQLVDKSADKHDWSFEKELELRHLRRVIEEITPVDVDYLGGRAWAVGALTGVINHACHPNATLEVDTDNEPEDSAVPTVTMKVFAVKDIRAGEEITISYLYLAGSVEQYLHKLHHYYGFYCQCHACERTNEDASYRRLREDVYALKAELQSGNLTTEGQLLRHTALLMDGYWLLDINHEVVLHLYEHEAEEAYRLCDTLRCHYFTRRLLGWYGGCVIRAPAMEAVKHLSELENSRTLNSPDTMGWSTWDYYDMSQENLEEVMFMMGPGRFNDQEYHLLAVVDQVVKEVPVEMIEKSRQQWSRLAENHKLREEEKKLQEERNRLQLQAMSTDELARILEEAPQHPSKKKKKSKRKAKEGTIATKDEMKSFVNDTAASESHDESHTGKSIEQSSSDDSKMAIEKQDADEHDHREMKQDAKPFPSSIATSSASDSKKKVQQMSLVSMSRRSVRDQENKLSRVNEWTKTIERSALGETDTKFDSYEQDAYAVAMLRRAQNVSETTVRGEDKLETAQVDPSTADVDSVGRSNSLDMGCSGYHAGHRPQDMNDIPMSQILDKPKVRSERTESSSLLDGASPRFETPARSEFEETIDASSATSAQASLGKVDVSSKTLPSIRGDTTKDELLSISPISLDDGLNQSQTWNNTEKASTTIPPSDQHSKTGTLRVSGENNDWITVAHCKKTKDAHRPPNWTSSGLQDKTVAPGQAPVNAGGRRQPHITSSQQDPHTVAHQTSSVASRHSEQMSSLWQCRINDLLQSPTFAPRRHQAQTSSARQDPSTTTTTLPPPPAATSDGRRSEQTSSSWPDQITPEPQKGAVVAAPNLAKLEPPLVPVVTHKEEAAPSKPATQRKRRGNKALAQKVSELEQKVEELRSTQKVSELEKEVEELRSRNQYLENVAGIVAEDDYFHSIEPYKSPFGAKDGTSKSEWLASKFTKKDFLREPRDLGHLLAAKDGMDAPLLGFVLKERRDSACGRVEGDKVFLERGRLRGHSFGGDGSKMDWLKQASVRESKEL